MAILIPSKNIFEKTNVKSNDNIITEVSVGANIPVPITEYDVTVHTEEIDTSKIASETVVLKDADSDTYTPSGNVNITSIASAYAEIETKYLKNHTISISRLNGNKTILKILDKLNDSGERNIRHSVSYRYTKYKVEVSDFSVSTVDNSFSGILSKSVIAGSSAIGAIEIDEVKSTASIANISATAIVTAQDDTNLSTATFSYNSATDQYEITVTVLVGLRRLFIADARTAAGLTPPTLTGVGEEEVYEPSSVEISFRGDVFSLDFKDRTFVVEDKDAYPKSPFSIGGNELLQTKETAEWIGRLIIDKYSRGKETANLTLSIGKYKNDNGDEAISFDEGKPRLFDIGDEVIPFNFSAYGDLVMSLDGDLPKVFSVAKSRVSYKGIGRQEISIREVGTFEGSKYLDFTASDGDSVFDTVGGRGSFRGEHLFIPRYNGDVRITKIADSAFFGNDDLLSVYISDTIEEIGGSAFRAARKIKYINFSRFSSCVSIGIGAFADCTSLLYVKLPPEMKELHFNLFSRCANLKRVFIPSKVEKAYGDVFYGCRSLKIVEIEDIDSYCQINRSSYYTNVYTSPFAYGADLYQDGKIVTKLVSSATNITYAAFYGCKSIARAYLQLASTIGASSFESCTNLKEIVISRNCSRIGDYAFNLTNLQRVFYLGSSSTEWGNINIGGYNEPLINAPIYYFSNAKPTTEGDYWHFVDGNPTIWQ